MSRASEQPTTAANLSSGGRLEQSFAETLHRLGAAPPLALAVSGGGDSIALMHLASRWAWAQSIDPESITVLTVDHGLRANSRTEAEKVGAWARALGFTHHILPWEGEKPESGIQAKARAARRELLTAWCRGESIQTLLMAHTADDQAETVAMRLERGSGPVGLAGMAASSEGPFGVRILRPLLGVTRDDLRAWLKEEGVPWIEDPSNDDIAFERVRTRQALAADPARREHLLAVSASAEEARQTHDEEAGKVLRRAARLHAAGWAEVDLKALRAAPEAAARRAVERLLKGLGGADHPPHRDSFARLWADLTGKGFRGATLAGCHIAPHGPESAVFGREARNLSPLGLTARKWRLWDNRFELWSSGPAEVRPLASVGLDAFDGEARERVKAAAPPVFRGALPVVVLEGGRLAVPHAGVKGGGELEVVFRALRPFGALRPGESVGGE